MSKSLLPELREAEKCTFFPPDRAFALAQKLIPKDQVREPKHPNDYAPLMAELFGITMIDRVGRWLVTGTDSEFDAKWLARVEWVKMFEDYYSKKYSEAQWFECIQDCKKQFIGSASEF